MLDEPGDIPSHRSEQPSGSSLGSNIHQSCDWNCHRIQIRSSPAEQPQNRTWGLCSAVLIKSLAGSDYKKLNLFLLIC